MHSDCAAEKAAASPESGNATRWLAQGVDERDERIREFLRAPDRLAASPQASWRSN